jgi:hypothetical protein
MTVLAVVGCMLRQTSCRIVFHLSPTTAGQADSHKETV